MNTDFTLFAPTDLAFEQSEIDVTNLQTSQTEDLLKLHVLDYIESYNSLVCDRTYRTLDGGERTQTICEYRNNVVNRKYQVGNGNSEGAYPRIWSITTDTSNGNILSVDNVILPVLPTISK